MAKSKAEHKLVGRVMVIAIEADVCDKGGTHGARVILTNHDDFTKTSVTEHPHVASALDAVLYLLLKSKADTVMNDPMNRPGGHA